MAAEDDRHEALGDAAMPRRIVVSQSTLGSSTLASGRPSVFITLPRSGRMACLVRPRPCFAEPPAESPSTTNSSLSSRPAPAGHSATAAVYRGRARQPAGHRRPMWNEPEGRFHRLGRCARMRPSSRVGPNRSDLAWCWNDSYTYSLMRRTSMATKHDVHVVVTGNDEIKITGGDKERQRRRGGRFRKQQHHY